MDCIVHGVEKSQNRTERLSFPDTVSGSPHSNRESFLQAWQPTTNQFYKFMVWNNRPSLRAPLTHTPAELNLVGSLCFLSHNYHREEQPGHRCRPGAFVADEAWWGCPSPGWTGQQGCGQGWNSFQQESCQVSPLRVCACMRRQGMGGRARMREEGRAPCHRKLSYQLTRPQQDGGHGIAHSPGTEPSAWALSGLPGRTRVLR